MTKIIAYHNIPQQFKNFMLQIQALQTKYQKLEEELIKSRRISQERMLTFMEEEVGTKLTNTSNERMKMEARLRHNHQVFTEPQQACFINGL